MIRREVLTLDAPLSAEQLKWETAMRPDGAEATSRAMIQRTLIMDPAEIFRDTLSRLLAILR